AQWMDTAYGEFKEAMENVFKLVNSQQHLLSLLFNSYLRRSSLLIVVKKKALN
ncbi:hypothetical protein QBC46DRAFT_273577, partial [Diplogelasinospora grovesii]